MCDVSENTHSSETRPRIMRQKHDSSSRSTQGKQKSSCFQIITVARTSQAKHVSLVFAGHQAIRGPSWSKPGLAPMCSTRFCQLAPRK